MSFEQKSTGAMVVTLIVVFGWYFAEVIAARLADPGGEMAYQLLLAVMVGVLVALAAISHIVIAALGPTEARAGPDERDRLIDLRCQLPAGYVLATGAVVAMAEAMVDIGGFWIAHTLLASLVLSEIAKGVFKLAAYRRGV